MDLRRSAIVAAAVSQIGPGDIPKYWASCGIKPAPKPSEKGGQWCGAFALWCLHQAGVALNIPWLIGIGFCAVRGRELKITKTPQPGDIMYLDKPWQHHGVVESYENGVLTTIEGNTPTVQRRVRTDLTGLVFYSIDRFLNVPTPVPTPTPAPTPPAPAVEPDDSGLLRGIDVSHHQAPGQISWQRLAETHRFVIARATYGTRLDETCVEHVHRAQDVGLTVGLYHFYRPGEEAKDQLDAFHSMADAVDMGEGWLAPAIDIEQNQKYDGEISAERYAPAVQIVEAWLRRWGRMQLYTNPAMWPLIGNPPWAHECSIWTAHYKTRAPKTPLDLPWAIWQYLVAPLPGVYSGDIDQNWAKGLPLISLPTEPSLLPLEQDLDELRRDRDEFIKNSG